jgi:hypothetical protein
MVFQCRDKDGISVVCSRECWENHIIAEHPEMNGCETYVKAAIENPYQVYQDSKNINKKIIYKPFILPRPFNQQYLRVVIEYKAKRFRAMRGYILSAFPCINIKKGDILIWTVL